MAQEKLTDFHIIQYLLLKNTRHLHDATSSWKLNNFVKDKVDNKVTIPLHQEDGEDNKLIPNLQENQDKWQAI